MIVTKATATVETVQSDNPNGEFDVILSTKALDRDGDELNADEWKQPLPEHITFDSDHGMSVATTVGSGKPFINDSGQLQVRGTFASTAHAQNVRTLVNEGHIKTTSVAFIERKTQKGAKPQRDLLNGAFVAVPANPEAVVLSSKSVVRLLKAADAPVDAPPAHDDMVQAIHDAAVHLGAMCAANEAADSGESDGANKSVTKTSSQEAGTPQESAEESATESAVTAEKSAATAVKVADESADDVALRGRALVFLLKQTSKG